MQHCDNYYSDRNMQKAPLKAQRQNEKLKSLGQISRNVAIYEEVVCVLVDIG